MADSRTTAAEKSSEDIIHDLIGEMAAILHDIAPPDGQRRIARLMDDLRFAVQREAATHEV